MGGGRGLKGGRGLTRWAWPNEGDGYAVVGVAWRGGRDLERWAWPSGSRKSPRQHLRRWAWPPLGGGRGQGAVGVAKGEPNVAAPAPTAVGVASGGRWAWPGGGGRGPARGGAVRAVRERSGANGALRAAEDGSERAAVLCGWVRGWKGGGGVGGGGVRGGARSGNGGGGGEGGKGAGLGRALATPTPLRPRPRGAVPALKPRPPPPRGHALFWSRPAAARSCSGHAHLAVATPPS